MIPRRIDIRRLANTVMLVEVPTPLRLMCFASVGMCLGMATWIARISEASSYMSDDPKTCINCHIMFPEYATWLHSSHGRVTNCNDCHVPHSSLPAKLYFKAKDGMRHSALFTLRMEPQIIRAIPESKRVIQENCLRCHSRVLDDVRVPGHGDFDRACTDCHREVPHGRVHSLSSTPNASVPPLSPVTPEWLDRAIRVSKENHR